MKKTTLSLIFVAVIGLFLQAPALAQFNLQVTEVNPFGTDFNDPSDPDAVEFIEVTNVGNLAFTSADGDLFFDDDAPNAANADPLFGIPAAGIAPGESAIFLNIDFDPVTGVTGDFTDVTGAAFFQSQFPSFTGTIGFFDGSGLSSSGADGANLFLTAPGATPALGDIISSLVFPAGSQVDGQTFQVIDGGTPTFADPTPGFVASVPEPATTSILALGGLFFLGNRRRR